MAHEATSSGARPPQSVISGDGFLPPRGPESLKHFNPLVAKTAAILSTTYSDGEFREALSVLDDRGIKNDPKTRRQLRLEILKEVIDSNEAIINEYGRVAEQLRRIGFTLGKLKAGYDDMKTHLLYTQSETLPVLTEAASLLQQRSEVEMKQKVLTAFKQHFIMSEEEVTALTSTAEPVDENFFDALSRAKNISRDCEILLGFENQKLGSDLMEQTSQNLDFGFQKLYKWVQREFKSLNLDDPQMNSQIRRALRVLVERTSLFQNCLSFFAEVRGRILSNAFYIALTGDGFRNEDDTPLSKPIDFIAHDPLRYVGDMFAWIHSTMVSEKEVLEALFVDEREGPAADAKLCREPDIWLLAAEEGDDSNINALHALSDLVDQNIAGASRILRQRVERAIHSNEDTITAYKLTTLIGFYRVTIQKLVRARSELLECVESLETEASRQFRALVKDSVVLLQAECQLIPSNLDPPSFFQDALSRLEAIMKTHEISLSTSDDRKGEFELVLCETLDPFLSACEDMAAPIKMPKDSMFLINCKTAATKILSKFEFTRDRAVRLHEEIKHEAARLVVYQHNCLRDASGLSSLLRSQTNALNGASNWSDKLVLEQKSQQLDNFLPSALMDAKERFKDLSDLELAREITESAVDNFCADFKELELMLKEADENLGASDESGLRSVFPRTTAEIKVLLS